MSWYSIIITELAEQNLMVQVIKSLGKFHKEDTLTLSLLQLIHLIEHLDDVNHSVQAGYESRLASADSAIYPIAFKLLSECFLP